LGDFDFLESNRFTKTKLKPSTRPFALQDTLAQNPEMNFGQSWAKVQLI